MRRGLAGWFFLALLCVPGAHAGEAGPAVVLRARSVDALRAEGKGFLDQLGLSAALEKLAVPLRAKTGPKGLEGLDPKRPLGLFLHFDPDPAGALLVPVTSEKAFVDLLQRLDIRADRGDDG